MQFTLASLLPAALLVTSVVASGATIEKSLEDISKKTITLNSTVAAWKGDLFSVGPILSDSSALTDAINAGTKTAQASKNLTDTETFTIVPSTLDLVSDVQSVLKTLVAAKPKFDALLIGSPLVLNILKTDKTDADQFSAAVIAKVPSDLKQVANTIVAPIDTAFTAAINKYSGFLGTGLR